MEIKRLFFFALPLLLLSACGQNQVSSIAPSYSSTTPASSAPAASSSSASSSKQEPVVVSSAEPTFDLSIKSASGTMQRNSDGAQGRYSSFEVESTTKAASEVYVQLAFDFELTSCSELDASGYCKTPVSTEIVFRCGSKQAEKWCMNNKMKVGQTASMPFNTSLAYGSWTVEVGEYFG